MRRAAAALSLLAVLLAAPGAGCGTERSASDAQHAPAPVTRDAVATLRAAQALVGVDARRLGVRVALQGPRPGLAARLDQANRTVTLFAPASIAPHRLAHDLAHELGHAVDLDRLSAADRRAYLARRGRPGARWWPAAGAAPDYATGAGDFAEVFALCHAASPVFRSRLAPRPHDACALLPGAASSFAASAPKDG